MISNTCISIHPCTAVAILILCITIQALLVIFEVYIMLDHLHPEVYSVALPG